MARIVDHSAKHAAAARAATGSPDIEDMRAGHERTPTAGTSLATSASASSTVSSRHSASELVALGNEAKEVTGAMARILAVCRKATHVAGPGQNACWAWDFDVTHNRTECVLAAQKACPELTGMLPPGKDDRRKWREANGYAVNKAMRTKRNTVRTQIEGAADLGSFAFVKCTGANRSFEVDLTEAIQDEMCGYGVLDGDGNQVTGANGVMSLAGHLLGFPQSTEQYPDGLRGFRHTWNLFARQVLEGGPRILHCKHREGDRFEAVVGTRYEAIVRFTVGRLLLQLAGEKVVRKPVTPDERHVTRQDLRTLEKFVQAERDRDNGHAEDVRLAGAAAATDNAQLRNNNSSEDLGSSDDGGAGSDMEEYFHQQTSRQKVGGESSSEDGGEGEEPGSQKSLSNNHPGHLASADGHGSEDGREDEDDIGGRLAPHKSLPNNHPGDLVGDDDHGGDDRQSLPDPPLEEEGAIPQRETRTLRSSPSKEATQFAGCEESRKEVTGWLAAKATGLSQKNWLASSSINTANELTKKRASAKRVLPDADAGLSQARGRSRRKR